MNLLLTILIVLASIVLVLIVLVQNPKGGGLASSFSSANQILGVRKTTNTVEKITWILVAAIVVLSVATTAFTGVTGSNKASEISDKVETPVMQAPNFEESIPATEGNIEAIPLTETETPAE
jgi:preprotein translocase subunit SecG